MAAGPSLVDRVAELFPLCYGQPLARMVRLTIDHVTAVSTGTSIRFGRTGVDRKDPIGQLVRELIIRRGRAATGAPEQTPVALLWRSPGAPALARAAWC